MGELMTDLLQAIEGPHARLVEGSSSQFEVSEELIRRAVEEISRLRGVAGSVTSGPSFSEMRQSVKAGDA